MPMFAHFSKAAYDKLGHDAIADLVDYVNHLYDVRTEVDALRRELTWLREDIRVLTRHVTERLSLPPGRADTAA